MRVHLSPMIFLIVALIVVFIIVRASRPSSHPGRRVPRPPLPPRPPAPPPTPRYPMRPVMNVSQFILSLPLSPILLPLWALASIGALIAGPIHLALAIVGTVFSLGGSLIGIDMSGLWRSTGNRWRSAGRSFGSVFSRLLSTFGFGGVVDRLSGRSRAPEPIRPKPAAPTASSYERTFPFEDLYRIESHRGTGGSTARIFVVRRVVSNKPVGDRLVLKYFDMDFGSRLEEVIRESRGMQLAKEMGIVVDHHLAEDHFYYVMPYYEGETLTRAAARIHRHLSAEDPIPEEDVGTCLSWMADLLRTLDGYHRHGVIHKDVKPDNVIVTDDGVRVVDLGLLTPLTSALTLTTHGTEYFRDPEMVKLAVQGKRVKDVHAVRFDVYSSGAVLYYLLEGSFPACGPLSRFSRPVPMVLSWIVSRAMAEGEKRYPSVAAMRADLEAVTGMLGNGGLDDVPVSRLPSFSGFKGEPQVEPPPPPMHPEVLTPVAPARSVKPLAVRARRSGREAFGCWGFLMLFAALMVGVMYVTMSSPAPEPPATVTGDYDDTGEPRVTFTAENLAEQVLAFRGELGARMPPRSVGSLDDVPILFVTSDLGVDEVVRDASRILADRGVTIHPSTELAEAVKDVLTPQATPADVQRVLLEKLGTDTLPIVVEVSWVIGIGGERTYPDYRVRVWYLTLFRETGMYGEAKR